MTHQPPTGTDGAQQPKKGRGCMTLVAIVVGAFAIMIGLVAACGPETTEVEVPGPEVTVTETVTTQPATVTETTTVTEEAETPETGTAPEPAPEPDAEPDTVQQGLVRGGNTGGFANPPLAPAPAPAPTRAPVVAPAPASAARTVTGGAFCKNVEVGHTGQTTTGLPMTCTKNPGENRARWR